MASSSVSVSSVVQRPLLKPILLAGLIAGILDGSDAVISSWLMRSVPPGRVFQFIASGALGSASFEMGTSSVLLGVFFHFLIATAWAAVYYFASRRFGTLVQKPFLWAPLFGLLVFVVMHYGVVPLSAVRRGPISAISYANQIFAHVFCVGLPIALSVRRWGAR